MRPSRREIQGIQVPKTHTSEDAFKEGKGIQGGERHLRREEAFKEGRGILGGKLQKSAETDRQNCSLI